MKTTVKRLDQDDHSQLEKFKQEYDTANNNLREFKKTLTKKYAGTLSQTSTQATFTDDGHAVIKQWPKVTDDDDCEEEG